MGRPRCVQLTEKAMNSFSLYHQIQALLSEVYYWLAYEEAFPKRTTVCAARPKARPTAPNSSFAPCASVSGGSGKSLARQPSAPNRSGHTPDTDLSQLRIHTRAYVSRTPFAVQDPSHRHLPGKVTGMILRQPHDLMQPPFPTSRTHTVDFLAEVAGRTRTAAPTRSITALRLGVAAAIGAALIIVVALGSAFSLRFLSGLPEKTPISHEGLSNYLGYILVAGGSATAMRRLNIDELPQFWNVLKREMSLVGPRPERPELIAGFKHEIPHYNARHTVKPGITGWAQINGFRGDTDLAERIRHDIFYMENWSLWIDLQRLVFTFFAHCNAY